MCKEKILGELKNIDGDSDYLAGKRMGLAIAAGLCGCIQEEINKSILL